MSDVLIEGMALRAPKCCDSACPKLHLHDEDGERWYWIECSECDEGTALECSALEAYLSFKAKWTIYRLNGADGLLASAMYEDCACSTDDLMPCGGGPMVSGCVRAIAVPLYNHPEFIQRMVPVGEIEEIRSTAFKYAEDAWDDGAMSEEDRAHHWSALREAETIDSLRKAIRAMMEGRQ